MLKKLYDKSEYIQNQLYDKNDITDEDIILCLDESLPFINFDINCQELIEILFELLDYKKISFWKDNIFGYVKIYIYFLVNDDNVYYK